jgi:plasmid stability protein
MEMSIRFDEKDDLVVENIPDDIIAKLERRALARGWTAEEEMRDIFIRAYSDPVSEPIS